jgi:hypothetical protein
MKEIINIYFAPFNDMSYTNIHSLEKVFNFNLLGFVDKNIKNQDIISPKELSQKNFDKVIISSGGYYKEIYNEYVSIGINKNKISFYHQKTNKIFDNIYIYTLYIMIYKPTPIINNKMIDWELYFGANSKKLRGLKNQHQNKRAFILGNGPSLRIKDLDMLENEITFASNKIYLCFNETKWRPTYYFVEDDLVFKQNYEKLKNLKGFTKFFPSFTKRFRDTIDDGIYYRLNFKPHNKNFPQLSINPIDGFYWGSTVIYSMVQMALYMGIKEIYLLGVDFTFTIPKSKNINSIGRNDLICEGELNHFHKDYRKIGEKWNMPNLDIQLKVFKKLKEYANKNGIEVYNASTNSKLKFFEKKSILEMENIKI